MLPVLVFMHYFQGKCGWSGVIVDRPEAQEQLHQHHDHVDVEFQCTEKNEFLRITKFYIDRI